MDDEFASARHSQAWQARQTFRVRRMPGQLFGNHQNTRAADTDIRQCPLFTVTDLKRSVIGGRAFFEITFQSLIGEGKPGLLAGSFVQPDEQQSRSGPAVHQPGPAEVSWWL